MDADMSRLRSLVVAFTLAAGLLTPGMAAFGAVPPPVPALPDTDRVTSYSISASTCACNVNFALYGDSTDYQNWLTVWLNGVQVSFNDPVFGWTITSPTGSLGFIPLPITDGVLTFTTPQTGTVQIVGARRPRRVSQFSENTGVSARNLNQALTDIIAQNRETWDLWERSLVFEPGFFPNALPLAANRAGMYLCFGPTGQPTVCSSASGSGSISQGNGISFTGTNPTSISANIINGTGIVITPSGGAVQVSAGPGVDTNVSTAITGATSLSSGNCGQPVAAGGNAFYTINIGAASGFAANCVLTILNTDTWASGRGKNLSVAGLSILPTSVLYPTELITLRNIANTWVQDPPWRTVQTPLGQKLFVDVANGSDGNDCLASGAGNACQTISYVIMHLIWQQFVATCCGGSPAPPDWDIRLATNPACTLPGGTNCYAGAHISGAPKQGEGHNSIMIECDGGSATNCTILDASGSQAIGMYACDLNVELKNVTLGGNGNNDIQAECGMIRFEGGVVLGPTNSPTIPQLSAINRGVIVGEGGGLTTVNGGTSGFLAQAAKGGLIDMDQHTFSFSANTTYGQQTLNGDMMGMISVAGTAWMLNGHTITAPNNIGCAHLSMVNTGGSPGNVPGTNTPSTSCTNSPNGNFN
jgi:hypothetical protein